MAARPPRGATPARTVGRAHADGFSRALDKALAKLDPKKAGGKTYELRYSVKIAVNPGDIGEYRVDLIPQP